MSEFYTNPEETITTVFGLRMSHWVFLVHVGLLVGSLMALRHARVHGVSEARLAALIVVVYAVSMTTAHAASVLFDAGWDHFRRHPMHALEVWRGGFVLYGGVVGAVLVASVGARVARVSFGRCADACAPGVAAGIAIGRVGCFASGCCYGVPTSFILGIEYKNFAVSARPIGVPLHPAPLYEAAGTALIAVYLWRRTRTPSRYPGDALLVFLALYGVLRFLVEFVRADQRGTIAGLPTSQFVSLIVVPAAVGWIAVRHRYGQGSAGTSKLSPTSTTSVTVPSPFIEDTSPSVTEKRR